MNTNTSNILPPKLQSLYKNIETLNPKDFSIRKKINIFIAKNLENETTLIFQINQKSRFLQKDAEKIEEILSIILEKTKQKLTKKTIIIDSPLCSKAKLKLEEKDWLVLV